MLVYPALHVLRFHQIQYTELSSVGKLKKLRVQTLLSNIRAIRFAVDLPRSRSDRAVLSLQFLIRYSLSSGRDACVGGESGCRWMSIRVLPVRRGSIRSISTGSLCCR